MVLTAQGILRRRRRSFLLVHRGPGGVRVERLAGEAFAALSALKSGATLVEACRSVARAERVSAWCNRWAREGVFRGLRPARA